MEVETHNGLFFRNLVSILLRIVLNILSLSLNPLLSPGIC
jgi:hypothetical protein